MLYDNVITKKEKKKSKTKICWEPLTTGTFTETLKNTVTKEGNAK